MGRHWANALAFGALLLAASMTPRPAWCDQNDPRLDQLFALLVEAPDVEPARAVEQRIWSLWLESDDRAVTLLMRQGMAAMARDDLGAALRAFDQVVKIAPDYAEGWNKRATVHYLRGDFGASLADIRKTLALEPRHFGALSGRGLVYVALGDEVRALEAFEAALEIHPNLYAAKRNAEILRKRLDEQKI